MVYFIFIALLCCTLIFFLYRNQRVKEQLSHKTQELKDTALLFDTIFKNIQTYVLLIDSNFFVLKTNFYALTGTEEKEKKRVGELFHCVNSYEVGECGKGLLCKTCMIRQTISHALQHKSNFTKLDATLQMRLSDHETNNCNVLVHGSYIHSLPSGGMLLTIYDITDQKQTQIRLHDAKEKIERIEKSKSILLTNLGHKIRNQLNGILGWTSLIISDKNLTPSQQEEYLNLVYQSSDSLLQVTDNMLKFSQIDEDSIDINLSIFNIKDLCQNLVNIRFHHSNPNVKLFLDKKAEDLFVYSDQIKLHQILLNLISNAQKYTKKGFIRIAFQVNEKRNRVEFMIEDTGSGMTSELQTHLIERFYKGNDFSDGQGLGLSICQAYIKVLGGYFRIESEEERGTRILFSIQKNNIPKEEMIL